MNRSQVASIIVAAGLAAGCVDRGIEPMAPAGEDVSAVTGVSAAVEGGTWIVDFKGKGPQSLAADVHALGGRVDYVVQSVGFAVVSGLSDDAASTLAGRSGIASVFADVETFLDAEPVIGDAEALDVEAASIANPAGGIRFSYQWNQRVVGSNVAWAAGALGSPNVTIAILDTGIDYDGYDMNGMVDLARSASFLPNDDAIVQAFFPGRHPIDDLNGHGSNVASQASSNATIFAGVNSRARLMGVKVLGYNGSGSLAAILAGLAYAADNGADVANMSLGVRFGVNKSHNGRFVGLTNRVFNYVHRMGMTVVVSAGNDRLDMDETGRIFRAYCEAPHVICVAATGPTASTNSFSGPWSNIDTPTSYTNYGHDVTVSAPGGTTFGWVSSVCARHRIAVSSAGTVTAPCNAPPGFFVTTGYSGTSQAAPHVTGIVAQIIAKHGRIKPSQVKHILLTQGVDDLGAPGKDPYYGAGRVNLAKALGL